MIISVIKVTYLENQLHAMYVPLYCYITQNNMLYFVQMNIPAIENHLEIVNSREVWFKSLKHLFKGVFTI